MAAREDVAREEGKAAVPGRAELVLRVPPRAGLLEGSRARAFCMLGGSVR